MRFLILPSAFVLDLIFGDPAWLPHPVVLIGREISLLEHFFRARFPKTEKGERQAGLCTALSVCLSVFGLSALLLAFLYRLTPWAGFVAETFFCCQLLAAKSLYTESMKVCTALKRGDLEGARRAVSMIVGRDTKELDEAGIIRAAVETVAENSSDGEIAPLFYMALGGAPLAFLYKAVNTMDSMLGYKNERYLYFGSVPARLDDAANFLPARLSGLLLCLGALFTGLDAKNAFRIFKRDRKKHASPNAGQCEAPVAGALHVQLLGDASYFGKTVHKPTIGDDDRPIEALDILRSNQLMLAASLSAMIICSLLRLL